MVATDKTSFLYIGVGALVGFLLFIATLQISALNTFLYPAKQIISPMNNGTHQIISSPITNRQISSIDINSFQSHQQGEYAVWVSDLNGAGQIYRYHQATGQILQLSFSSNNQLPLINEQGDVVWQRWNGEGWHIMSFNGKHIQQLSSKDATKQLDLQGDIVSFLERNKGEEWQHKKLAIPTAISTAEELHLP